MLTTLRIKNLALVPDLTLELQPGCNVITGETGAGKSIIIGALNLVLGERADRTLIRNGSDSCSVEATFDIWRLHINRRGMPASGTARLENTRKHAVLEAGAPSPLEIFWRKTAWSRARKINSSSNAPSPPAERTASSSMARPPR